MAGTKSSQPRSATNCPVCKRPWSQHVASSAASDEHLIDTAEAALRLGIKDPADVREMARRGELRGVKVGNRVRIYPSSVDAYREAHAL